MNSVLILALMGDPMLPAGSCDRTGGFNVDTYELIEFLSRKDYSCLIITNQSDEAPVPYERINRNIQLCRISLNGADQNQQDELLRQADSIKAQILELLNRLSFSPALIHSYYWLSGYIACSLSDRLNIPFIHSIVALAKDKEQANAKSDYHVQMECEYRFFPKARYIFSITDTEKETLCSQYPVCAHNVFIVGREIPDIYRAPVRNELGVARELNPFAPLKYLHSDRSGTDWWNSGAFTYVGRPKPEKGIPHIIRAWNQLYRHYGAKTPPLWIVGGDVNGIERLRESLCSYIPELPEHEKALRVCWWGHLNAEGISTLYLKTLALVTHSQYEAGGRVIIEAMSQAKPVIATPTGFAKDLITDWHNGFLVEYGDTERLFRRMSLFASQPLLSNSLGLTARETILTARNRWNGYQRIEQIYQQLLGYTSEPSFSKQSLSPTETVDHFACGMLSAYPYAYNRDIYTEKRCYMPHSPASGERVSKAFSAWMCFTQIKGVPALSLRYYSRLNEAKIWNNQTETEAIAARDRYSRAIFSCENDAVLSPLAYHKESCQITVPYYGFLATDKLQCHGKEMLALLSRFSLSAFPGHTPVYSDQYGPKTIGWNSMCRELSGQLAVFPTAAEILPVLKALLANGQSEVPGPEAWNYGAGLAEHVCELADGAFALMPAPDIFWGEAGYDAGQFLYDYFIDILLEEKGRQLVRYAADCYCCDESRVLKWVLLAALERLLRSSVEDIPVQAGKHMKNIRCILSLFSNR